MKKLFYLSMLAITISSCSMENTISNQENSLDNSIIESITESFIENDSSNISSDVGFSDKVKKDAKDYINKITYNLYGLNYSAEPSNVLEVYEDTKYDFCFINGFRGVKATFSYDDSNIILDDQLNLNFDFSITLTDSSPINNKFSVSFTNYYIEFEFIKIEKPEKSTKKIEIIADKHYHCYINLPAPFLYIKNNDNEFNGPFVNNYKDIYIDEDSLIGGETFEITYYDNGEKWYTQTFPSFDYIAGLLEITNFEKKYDPDIIKVTIMDKYAFKDDNDIYYYPNAFIHRQHDCTQGCNLEKGTKHDDFYNYFVNTGDEEKYLSDFDIGDTLFASVVHNSTTICGLYTYDPLVSEHN